MSNRNPLLIETCFSSCSSFRGISRWVCVMCCVRGRDDKLFFFPILKKRTEAHPGDNGGAHIAVLQKKKIRQTEFTPRLFHTQE